MSIASPPRRTTLRWTLAVLTLSATVVAGLSATPAVAGGSFRAVAAADAARVTVVAVNGPATNVPVDLGAPAAQASLDSLGTNQSFASQPYPGDLLVSAPGLVAGASNGQLTPPDYPLYVSADYPLRPERAVEQPGYHLKATAAEQEAAASAGSGATSENTSAAASAATARVVSEGGAVTGDASSITNGFSAGPLTIGRISSTASVTRQPDGTLARHSALDIAGAKVGDTTVTISPDGIKAGAAGAPVPDGSALTKTLSQAGVAVKYLSGIETENGLVAPALEVSWTQAVPGPVSPVTLIWTLGRVAVRIDGSGPSEAAVPLPTIEDGGPAPAQPTDALAGAAAAASSVPAVPGSTAALDAPAAVFGSAFTAAEPTTALTGDRLATSSAAAEGIASSGGAGAEVPAPGAIEVAAPAGVLLPPDFDIRSSFGALALAVLGSWVVTRRWIPFNRQSNNK